MKDETTILVVCERPNDGPPIDRLLTNDFSSVVVSIDPRRHLSDFELYKPAVLVLALTTIAKAERFLQHLERPGTLAGALPFRVIALASRDDAAHAFELCQQGRFDAYVNQGSEADDPMQLRLAVRGAARSIASERAGAPTPSQFALHARRAVTVGSTLDERLADCTQALDAIESAVAQARGDMTSALDKLGRALASAPQETRTELAYLRDIAIASQFQLIGATVQAAHERMGGLKGDISTLHDTLRSMRALGEAVRPRILVIDDDKFQHRLLQQILATLPVETAFATSAAEGFVQLHGRRADLVLMDVGLPDFDGVQATRLLKTSPRFGSIPVMMITGVGGKETVVESLKAGAADFVVKPIDRAMLLGKTRKLLGLPAQS